MPTISEFYGMKIQMFYKDHAPPHFHVRYSDSKATVGIQTLAVLTGSLPRTAERLVLEWARMYQEDLMEDWKRCELRAPLAWIKPLN